MAALTNLPTPRGLHVDVHGKADRVGEADLDVGVGALRAHCGDAIADTVAHTVANALRAALAFCGAAEFGKSTKADGSQGRGYTVDAQPRLQGCWRSVPRRTLTQSSVRLGYIPVQLELGYHLRRALGRDRELCKRVGEAFVECALGCIDAYKATTPLCPDCNITPLAS